MVIQFRIHSKGKTTIDQNVKSVHSFSLDLKMDTISTALKNIPEGQDWDHIGSEDEKGG